MSIKKTVALVTGSAQGIGAAISQTLLDSGFNVIGVDVDSEKLKEHKNRLNRHKEHFHFVEANVSDPKQVKEVIRLSKEKFKQIDVLINNAGIGGPFHRIDEVSDKEWDLIFRINVKAPFFFLREILPDMKKRNFGRIVNICSIQGLLGAENSSTYVASKHALIGYTKSVAAEWGRYNITSNAICPGYIDTRMGIQENSISDHKNKILSLTPSGKTGTSLQVADLVKFIIKTESAYLNGSIITLDGGISSTIKL
jgi:3-oxoacyl-[acyl-carrier protein] reductase